MRRVALVVGDTPGHLFPALAVAKAYERRRSDVEIVFLGPAEAPAVGALNHWRYYPVSSGQFVRVGMTARSRSAVRTLIGVIQARRRLRALNTEIVIGFGSYCCGAVLLAVKTLGLATAINEGNARFGLANRLLACFVRRVYLAHRVFTTFPKDRICVTGWPIRSEIAALTAEQRHRENSRFRVLVCSGSRCGAFFAQHVPNLLGRLRARGFAVSVLHHCADVEPELVAESYRRAGVDARTVSFIDDIATAYHWADFAIARAGAGTLAELAAAALPSLLVPLADAAGDHQSWNAREFAVAGAAVWMREDEWDSVVAADQIAAVMSDSSRWASMSATARQLAVPTAADAVVDDCERMLNGRA